MSNVIALHGAVPRAPHDYLGLLKHVHHLYVLGVLNDDAFKIGTLVACKMRQADGDRTAITMAETWNMHFEFGETGAPYAGATQCDYASFATALGQLQRWAGMRNHLTVKQLDKIRDPFVHFTDTLRRRRPLDDLLAHDTEVHFSFGFDRLPGMRAAAYKDLEVARVDRELYVITQ
jgi:hypothetical protein